MLQIPPYMFKLTPRDQWDELLEWRLSAQDVALLLGTAYSSVLRFADTGDRNGVKLECRFLPVRSTYRRRAFRLSGVRRFAERTSRTVDHSQLHPALQREWNVGPLAEGVDRDAKPASVVTPTTPKES